MVKTKAATDKDRPAGDKSSKKRRLSTTPPRVSNGSSCIKAGKSLRKLQMWTNEDTKCFFEAINEHGKDFPKIQSYIAQRCEKKGIPQEMIKNYEQVRHYYYRMWHKIANSLNINEVVDKSTQEIYGLINYGEIWKKFGTKFDNKLGPHLQQLVNFGHTTFKVKGKSVRVKTPICKALKKIHKINVSENPKTNVTPNLLNLPKEVTMELYPADNESWLRVHSLSQNPRVRTKLSLQKRLSALVEYLEKRWNPWRVVDAECRTHCGTPLPNGQQTDNQCLRVRPHSSGDLNNVSLSKSLFNSQMDLSLTAYIKTLYNNELKGSSKKAKTNKPKDKDLSADQSGSEANAKSTDANSETANETATAIDANDDKNNKSELLKNSDSKSDEDEPIAEAERSMTLLRMLAKMHEMSEEIHGSDEDDDKDDDDQTKEDDEQNKDDEEERDIPSPETSVNLCLPEPPTNATLAQWLSGTDNGNIDNNDIEEDNEEEKDSNVSENIENQLEKHSLSADRARKGWSLSECGSMTIGELYLLFRCPKKILLEYVWEPVVQSESNTSAEAEEASVGSAELKDSSAQEETQKNGLQSDKSKPCDLLQRLLLAANLSLQSIKRPSTSSMAQTQKKRRIKPTPAPLTVPIAGPLVSTAVPITGGSLQTKIQSQVISAADTSSQLLSNVISNTIFNDSNSNDGTTRPVNASPVPKLVTISSGGQPLIGPQTEPTTVHDFIVPKTPAPKAVNKTKSRNICGDPALIQEALRQLKSNKYTRRQRRPTPKPVFGQNKPLLPRAVTTTVSSATVSSQQPIYVIPSSHPIRINPSNPRTVLTQTLSAIPINAKNGHNSFDVAIADKHLNPTLSGHSLSGQTSIVTHLPNIPVIQLEPIPSVTVPIISSQQTSRDSRQTHSHSTTGLSLGLGLESALLSSKATTVSAEKTQTLVEKHNQRHNTCIENSVLKTQTNSVLRQNKEIHSENIDSNVSNVSEDSTEKLISNPHMSSILEISLPEPPFADNSSSSLTDYSLNDKRPFEKLSIAHKPVIALRTDPTLPTSVSQSSLASPPIGHKRTEPELPEHQWNGGESSDISLGTLLNACESPIKTVSIRDSHALTNDVDTNMSCLVDNSVDLMAKFEDLVKHVETNSKAT